MSNTATFQFLLLQKVVIRPLGLGAEVLARCERPGGLIEYRVIWWADSQRHDEWLLESELQAA